MTIEDLLPLLAGLAIFSVGLLLSTVKLLPRGPAEFLYGIVLSGMLSVLPIFLRRYFEMKRISMIEESLPAFFMDFANALNAGMAIPAALSYCASTEGYGPLNPIVKKMAIWVSWGVPFPRVIDKVITMLRKSRTCVLAFSILKEAHASGGKLADICTSLAESLSRILEINKRKTVLLRRNVLTLYALNIIFAGLMVMIFRLLVTMSLPPSTSGGGLGLGIGEVQGKLDVDFLKTMIVLSCFIVAGFSGIMMGVVEKGSFIAGLKHSFILETIVMIIISYIILAPPLSIVFYCPSMASPGEKLEITGVVVYKARPAENSVLNIVIEELGEGKKISCTDGSFSYVFEVPKDYRGTLTVILKAEYLNKYKTEKRCIINVKK